MSIEILSADGDKRVQSWDSRGRPNRTFREMTAKPRLYVHLDEGNDGYAYGKTQMEHLLTDRWTNDVQMYKSFIPSILTKLGLPDGTKATWSQKAGCSCGCSPAFIITLPTDKGLLSYQRPTGIDYSVTLGDPEVVAKAKVWREQGKSVRARKDAHSIILNAQQAFAEGIPVVRIKELNSYRISEQYIKRGDWAAAAHR